jgi:hypothetical protein
LGWLHLVRLLRHHGNAPDQRPPWLKVTELGAVLLCVILMVVVFVRYYVL